jgi:hypothetical protein
MAEAVNASAPPAEREWGALVFVGFAWTVITAVALVVAVKSASPIPWIDDWDLVRPITGDDPVWEWLWRPYINHRVPLPRLLLLGIYKVNGADFRAGPVINVCVLSALALVMIIAARRWRGRMEYTDAVFPLALLNVDNEVLFATLGVNLIPSTVLSCVLLLIMIQSPQRLRGRTVFSAGLVAIALGMCGSSGAAQVPSAALWLAYVGFEKWRSSAPGGRRGAALAWSTAAVALIYVLLSFPALERGGDAESHPGVTAAVRTSLEFLSTALGPAAWTVAGATFPPFPWVGVGVAIMAIITAALLVAAWIQHPTERLRAAGLLLFLTGMGVFAAGVGWGRAGAEPGAGYATRYAIYTSPILFAVYFAWELYGRRFAGRLVPTALLAALVTLLAPNMSQSWAQVKHHVQQARDMERDLLAGSPPRLLAERYKGFLLHDIPEAREHLPFCMKLLHAKNLGIFRHLKNVEFTEVSLPIQPERRHQIEWRDGVADCQGGDPFLVFALKEPRYVLGIRVRLRYEPPAEPRRVQLYWKKGEQEFADDQRTGARELPPSTAEQEVFVLVNDTIDHLRLDPATGPCAVRIEGIELFVPRSDQ